MPRRDGILSDALRLAPLLALYVALALFAAPATWRMDEERYVYYARNLTRGFYSPPNTVWLWSGPGYPVVLLPFALTGETWTAARVGNAAFFWLGLLCFCRGLRAYASGRASLLGTYLLGLYPPFLRLLPLLMAEPFAVAMVCALVTVYCRMLRDEGMRWPWLLAAAALAAWLALTKVVFGYALAVSLALACVWALLRRSRSASGTVAVCGLALVFCAPYLAYTYAKTGRAFYWSNAGGQSLYWMSMPDDGECGDWRPTPWEGAPEGVARRRRFMADAAKLPPLARDDAYRRRALSHIRARPLRYLRNWVCNVGRLLFNYPYSHTPQKPGTYLYFIPGMFLVTLSALCVYPTVVERRRTPPEVFALLTFFLVAFLGSSLLSAYNRQFQPLVPILVFWIVFTFGRLVDVRVRSEEPGATPTAPGRADGREAPPPPPPAGPSG